MVVNLPRTVLLVLDLLLLGLSLRQTTTLQCLQHPLFVEMFIAKEFDWKIWKVSSYVIVDATYSVSGIFNYCKS